MYHSETNYSNINSPYPPVQSNINQPYGTYYRTHPNQLNQWHSYYHQYYNPYLYRPYPEVDATLFTESAHEMQALMKEASLVLDRLAESKDFAKAVMTAAQESNQQKVDELLHAAGLHTKVDVSYNPDGINLKLIGEKNCCNLTIALRWR
mgnify:FL=1